MQEIFKLLIGVAILLLGFPIGSYLSKKTRSELKAGQKWFRLIVIVGLIGGIISLILGNDFLLFLFFFIAIVANQSLKRRK